MSSENERIEKWNIKNKGFDTVINPEIEEYTKISEKERIKKKKETSEKGLSKEQKEILKNDEKALLVVSSAGSGKCITNSLISTKHGLSYIKFYKEKLSNDNILKEPILSIDGHASLIEKETSHWFDVGMERVLSITTKNGFNIKGTFEHPLLVLDGNNKSFKRLDEIKKGERLLLCCKGSFSENNLINEKEASLIGYLLSMSMDEYHQYEYLLPGEDYHLYLNNSIYVIKDFVSILFDLFEDVEVKLLKKSKYVIAVKGDQYEEFLNRYGISYKNNQIDKIKALSDILLSSKEVVSSMVRSLFDAKSYIKKDSLILEKTFFTGDIGIDLQTILLQFGIKSKRDDYLSIKGTDNLFLYKKEIGFNINQKNNEKLCEIVPYKEGEIYVEDFFVEEVEKIEECLGKQNVYDFTVPDTHSFIANGFINHNTKILTEKVIHLINEDVDPERILLLTFTVKASEEMRERVTNKVGEDIASFIECGTFHSWAHKIMRRWHKILNLHKDFAILDSGDSLDVWNKCASMAYDGNVASGVKNLYSIFSLMRNKNISSEEAIKEKYMDTNQDYVKMMVERLEKISCKYTEYKKKHSLVDFDDFLEIMEVNLRENSVFRKEIAKKYDYVLVDEVQDCNEMQVSILKSLVKGNKEIRKENKKFNKMSLFACGDEAQCWTASSKVFIKKENNEIVNTHVAGLKEGDFVKCVYHGNVEYKRVSHIRRYNVNRYITVTTESGYTVSVSENHRFFVMGTESNRTYLVTLTFDSHEFPFKVKSIFPYNGDILVEERGFSSYLEARCVAEKIRDEKEIPLYERMNIRGKKFSLCYADSLSLNDRIPVVHNNCDVSIERITKLESISGVVPVFDIEVEDAGNMISGEIVSHNSIYGFRGADYKNMLKFPEEFNAKVSMLVTNYRSSQEILDFANAIGKNFTETRWEKEMKGVFHGVKPHYVRLKDETSQAEFVADTIEKMIKDEGFKGGEIAVLYRTNPMASPIEMALSARNIFFEKKSGMSIFEMSHIKDILSFLKAAYYHDDILSWTRMLELIPKVGVSTAEKIYSKCIKEEVPYKGLITNSHEINKIDTKEVGLLIKSLLKNNKRPQIAVDDVVEYLTPLFKTKFGEKYEDRKSSINALSIYAKHCQSIKKMLVDLTMNGSSNDNPNKGRNKEEERLIKRQGGRVVLSSVHSYKGLEQDNIFLINCVEGKFPSYWFIFEGNVPKNVKITEGMLDKDKLDSERRLFYVACTRARHNLILTNYMSYEEFEDWKNNEVIKDEHDTESVFLSEIKNLEDYVNIKMPVVRRAQNRSLAKKISEYE